MFENFKEKKILVDGININFKIGGEGEPLLLLHGYPQTHVLWRKLAPLFAKNYTVICSDLRGYGDSDKPKSDDIHSTYSKKSMAFDHKLINRIKLNKPLMIAGDIQINDHLENYKKIADIIDISGGLETSGVKDKSKIDIFLNKIK